MGSEYTALLGHLEKKSPLKVGQTVLQGDYIGRMGSSGKSTAPHLHLGLIDGIRSTVFRMAEIILSKKLLRQLAYFLMDTELFRNKNKATFTETFKDDGSSNVRQNIHTFYIPTQKYILSLAKDVGFILLGKIDMISVQYEYQYLYVLQKPE